MRRFEDKTALVTGGAMGLDAELTSFEAKRCSEDGDRSLARFA
jgi:hypothetical protein